MEGNEILLLDVVSTSSGKGEFRGVGGHGSHALLVVGEGAHGRWPDTADVPELHCLVMRASDDLQNNQ